MRDDLHCIQISIQDHIGSVSWWWAGGGTGGGGQRAGGRLRDSRLEAGGDTAL